MDRHRPCSEALGVPIYSGVVMASMHLSCVIHVSFFFRPPVTLGHIVHSIFCFRMAGDEEIMAFTWLSPAASLES